MDFSIWADFTVGKRVELVGETIVVDCGDHHIFRVLGTGSFVKVTGLPEEGAHTWTMLGVLVVSVDGMPHLSIDEQSTVFPHYSLAFSNLGKCIELCAGAGFMSTGARAAGMEPLMGFEQNSKFEQMFLANGGQNFHCLDIHDVECVKQAFRLGGQSAIVMSGIACQPYSRGGDERGGGDCRASTLPATLKFSWLMQAPIIVLECTPAAMTNEFVQTHIRQFAQKAGYHVHQQVLHLDRQWVGKRDRWWCVLSARPLGPVKFDDLPETTDFKVVSDVMAAPCEWPETEVAALELTLYEHHKIHCCSKGLEALLLNPKIPLPTALHSWGNQCYGCACGCRGAFSEKRLNERGVYAVLIALGPTIKHEGFVFPKCRHLHPSEVAVLSGARVINWEGCMRLGLAATGQMASPLQAVWVCAHVIDRISKFVQIPTVASPSECLAALRSLVLQDCEQLWKRPVEPQEAQKQEKDEPNGEHVKKWGCGEGNKPPPVTIQVGHLPSGVTMEIKVEEGRFVQSLVIAEATFWDCPAEELVCVDSQGNVLPDLCPLTPNMQVWIGTVHAVVGIHVPQDAGPPEPWRALLETKETEVVDAVMFPPRDMDLPMDLGASHGNKDADNLGHLGQLPQPIDHLMEQDVNGCGFSGDALAKLKKKGLLEMVTPQVFSKSALCGLRSQTMNKADRTHVLDNQEDVWGDDEILFHLQRVASSTNAAQEVRVWDPLMTTSLLKSLQGTLIDQAIGETPEHATIITAAVVEGHWIPLVWRKEKDQVCGFSIGIPVTHLLVVQNLHAWLCNQWKVPVTPFKAVNQHVPDFCGAVAISYVEHLLWATPMAGLGKPIIEMHRGYRTQFVNNTGIVAYRPWVRGKGQEGPDPVLLGLLRQHGVPAVDAVSRAESIVASLGKEQVKKALQGQKPWQDLKWVANQQVPPYQLIRPSELQAIVESRSKLEGPLGSKRQKSKGSGKGKG